LGSFAVLTERVLVRGVQDGRLRRWRPAFAAAVIWRVMTRMDLLTSAPNAMFRVG
jgi:hypothetical protein